MNIENIAIKDIKPYERNAKKHDERQIKNVMQSTLDFSDFDIDWGLPEDGDSAIMLVENTVQQRAFQQSRDDYELAMSRYFNDDIEAFLMIAINLLSKENNHAST